MRLIPLLLAGVLGTGCYATASTGYTPAYVGPSVAVTATTVAPDLVYVSPGVQVIADYDEPIFYADGFYWRETSGVWYRSSYHTHGWGYYAPPRHIVSIRDRHSYRRYRPAGYTPRNRNTYNPRASQRDYNPRSSYRPTARDGYRPAPAARNNGYRPAPAARDNNYRPAPAARGDYRPAPRTERRDNRKDDRKDDRKDRRR